MRRKIASLLVALAAALLLAPGSALAEEAGTVTIVHTNDSHGGYGLTSADGAPVAYYAVVAGLAESVGADLVVDAGDTFHGDSFATITSGESVARLMAAAGYDAMTPGNHDWSYGAARLLALSGQVPVLAANVVEADGSPFFSTPGVVRDVELESGETIQVGVIGVIDEDFYSSTPAYNVAGLSFADPVAAASSAAADLREQGCELVVALTHNEDPQGFAARVSGVDAVVAGHEHVLIDEVVTAADGREVPVVEAGSHLGYVGELELVVDRAEDGTYSVSSHEQVAHDPAGLGALADEAVEALTYQIAGDNEEVLGQAVGTSSRAFPYPDADYDVPAPGGWELVRTEDTPIGHAVTASYLAMTGADLALENAGGIRGGIPQGTVTVGDLVSVSPYGNTLATYEMTGRQVLDALETSLEISAQCREVLALQLEALRAGEDPMGYAWPDNSGSVLACGGATMQVDWSRPAGERIRSILVGGEPLDPERTYTVAMNSYLPSCEDYPLLATLPAVQEFGTCEQALRAFVGEDGWEGRVYELSGTVSYVDAGDDAEDPAEPEAPTDPEQPSDLAEQPSDPEQKVPATGDPTSALGLAALLGAGSASVCAAGRLRRRAAAGRLR